jgi:cation:H+ antiporter
MEWFINVAIFLSSCAILYISGELVISSLVKLSRFLGLKEFVVAFFIMAFAASLPNLFVGITSALQGVPELSLGDVFGNNFTALTLAVAVAALFSPQKEIQIESRTIKSSSLFAILAAILPVVLITDGNLSRIDGFLLLSLFFFYLFWLFSKRERFSKIYEEGEEPKNLQLILSELTKDVGKIFVGVVLIFIAAQGIVSSSSFFAVSFKIPISLIGLLIVGFGNALPEVYFSIASARKGETFMILGNLLGSVVIPATVVLGVVALIHPIQISSNSSFLLVSRFYMIAAATFFFIFSRSHNTISKKESIVLLLLYAAFILSLTRFL